MDNTSSTPNPIAGNWALFSHRLASTPAAMITAIQNRIVFAGRDALTSVYEAPVTLPRPE